GRRPRAAGAPPRPPGPQPRRLEALRGGRPLALRDPRQRLQVQPARPGSEPRAGTAPQARRVPRPALPARRALPPRPGTPRRRRAPPPRTATWPARLAPLHDPAADRTAADRSRRLHRRAPRPQRRDERSLHPAAPPSVLPASVGLPSRTVPRRGGGLEPHREPAALPGDVGR